LTRQHDHRKSTERTGVTSIFPVFIGVVGKRELSTGGPTDGERIVRQRLSATFDYIDSVVPNVPKVLLTGTASGSDLIAAEEVLGCSDGRSRRTGWLVLAALPFDEVLYREDFDAGQWETFKDVVSDPRTRSWVLPRLASSSDDVPSGLDLARFPGATETQKDLRRRHYEQVGLWIADTANILIAVMPQSEVTDKIGGSARIVAYRRGGRPDWTTREIIRASRVLAPRPELIRPPQGYVWLIDPSRAAENVEPPIIVLPPFADELERRAASPKPGYLYDEDKVVDGQEDADRKRHLRLSEIPLHIAEGHERAKPTPAEKGTQQSIGWPSCADPADVLSDMTNALRKRASEAEERSRWVFYTITCLFLLAILSFEIYTKFYPHEARLIIVYAILFALIIGFYLFARSSRLQAIAEDRRAVREVLRVQLAWWRAGLPHRVDFVHLQGADQDLGRVRDVARSAIVWACLVCKFRPPAERWSLVCSCEERPARARTNKFPEDWVGNQAFYFWLRRRQREYQAHIAESLSWMLFITSGCLAFLLFMVQMGGDEFKGAIAHWQIQASGHSDWMPLLAVFACLIVIFVLLLTRGLLGGTHSERNVILQSVVLGLAIAFILSLAIYLALWHASANPSTVSWSVIGGTGLALTAFCGAHYLRKAHPDGDAVLLGAAVTSLIAMILLALMIVLIAATRSHVEPADRAEYMIIVFIVFLTAMAAALRFLTEKLAIEAEALKYRDASDWFDRADDLLRAMRSSNWDDIARDQAKEVVKELGILALRENEAWLSARRERPLTPVM
jgi:hypothetical protein